MRLLAGRALTVRELRDRVARRGHGAVEIDRAVETLLERGYLDDALLAYNVAASLATRRMFGKARIAAELRRRGVAAQTIDAALDRAFAELDENELAQKAASRHAPPPAGAEGDKARERIARSLLRRGFSRGAVARVLERWGGSGDEGLGGDEGMSEPLQDDDHEL